MKRALRSALRSLGLEVRRVGRKPAADAVLCDSPREALLRLREGERTLINAPIRLLLRPNGWKFGPDAWNPFTQAAREFLDEPGTTYADSILCRYDRTVQPANAREAVIGLDTPLEPLESLPASCITGRHGNAGRQMSCMPRCSGSTRPISRNMARPARSGFRDQAGRISGRSMTTSEGSNMGGSGGRSCRSGPGDFSGSAACRLSMSSSATWSFGFLSAAAFTASPRSTRLGTRTSRSSRLPHGPSMSRTPATGTMCAADTGPNTRRSDTSRTCSIATRGRR